ncbi:hypothetical protein BXO590_03130 [Xanthomonas oryzae pv. oryzae]|nr:hypothetical protein BXO590_03130 [Xanthomonas oryzae pv. oryzae]OLH36833.1 hypothetical protein DXO116_04795 [Xanthomonas oryzae pv. oryzae]
MHATQRGTNAGAHLGAMRFVGSAAFAQDNRCALARTIVMDVAGNASSRPGTLAACRVYSGACTNRMFKSRIGTKSG